MPSRPTFPLLFLAHFVFFSLLQHLCMATPDAPTDVIIPANDTRIVYSPERTDTSIWNTYLTPDDVSPPGFTGVTSKSVQASASFEFQGTAFSIHVDRHKFLTDSATITLDGNIFKTTENISASLVYDTILSSVNDLDPKIKHTVAIQKSLDSDGKDDGKSWNILYVSFTPSNSTDATVPTIPPVASPTASPSAPSTTSPSAPSAASPSALPAASPSAPPSLKTNKNTGLIIVGVLASAAGTSIVFLISMHVYRRRHRLAFLYMASPLEAPMSNSSPGVAPRHIGASHIPHKRCHAFPSMLQVPSTVLLDPNGVYSQNSSSSSSSASDQAEPSNSLSGNKAEHNIFAMPSDSAGDITHEENVVQSVHASPTIPPPSYRSVVSEDS